MGSIPILRRCAAVEAWGASQANGTPGLPICFVDDWAELNEVFLAREYARLAPLAADPANLRLATLSYWVEQIASFK